MAATLFRSRTGLFGGAPGGQLAAAAAAHATLLQPSRPCSPAPLHPADAYKLVCEYALPGAEQQHGSSTAAAGAHDEAAPGLLAGSGPCLHLELEWNSGEPESTVLQRFAQRQSLLLMQHTQQTLSVALVVEPMHHAAAFPAAHVSLRLSIASAAPVLRSLEFARTGGGGSGSGGPEAQLLPALLQHIDLGGVLRLKGCEGATALFVAQPRAWACLHSLNLSGCGLAALPPEVGQLTRLRLLRINHNGRLAVSDGSGQQPCMRTWHLQQPWVRRSNLGACANCRCCCMPPLRRRCLASWASFETWRCCPPTTAASQRCQVCMQRHLVVRAHVVMFCIACADTPTARARLCLCAVPPAGELRHCSQLRELHLEHNRLTTPLLDLTHASALASLQVRGAPQLQPARAASALGTRAWPPRLQITPVCSALAPRRSHTFPFVLQTCSCLATLWNTCQTWRLQRRCAPSALQTCESWPTAPTPGAQLPPACRDCACDQSTARLRCWP